MGKSLTGNIWSQAGTTVSCSIQKGCIRTEEDDGVMRGRWVMIGEGRV